MALAVAPPASPTAWLRILSETLQGTAKAKAALLLSSLIVEKPGPDESFRYLVPLTLVEEFKDFLSPLEVAGANWNVVEKLVSSDFAALERCESAVVHPGSVRLAFTLTLTKLGKVRLRQLEADAARRATTRRTDVRVRDPMLCRFLLACSGGTVTSNGAVIEGGCDRQCRAVLGEEVLPPASSGTCAAGCCLGERVETLTTAEGITRSLLSPKYPKKQHRVHSGHGCSAMLLLTVPLSVGNRGFARVALLGAHSESWRPLGCRALRTALAFQDAVVTAAFYLGLP